ncbi:MAG TPA: hypothetical protein VM121_09600 [Acidimicrobiales bacterium]|nr:hypothetical protein [Acidimicrobiales bacterium]
MEQDLIVVSGYVATAADDTNIRDDAWAFALDDLFRSARLTLEPDDEWWNVPDGEDAPCA